MTKNKYFVLFFLLVISLFLIGCWGDTKEKLAVCNSSLDTCNSEKSSLKNEAESYKRQYTETKSAFDTYKQGAEKREGELKTEIDNKETKLTDCEAGKNQCVGELKALRNIQSYLWAGLIFQILFDIGFLFIGKGMEWIEIDSPAFWFMVGITILFIGALVYFYVKF